MAQRPNIIILLPDQLRHDFLGCYGADFLETPHIDALAARGTLFEDAVAPFPLCVPMRASMLTGLDAVATGILDNEKWLRPDRRAMGIETWAEMLSAQGYHTASIGKMHFYPWDLSEGFKERLISEDKRHIHVQDDYAAFLQEHGLAKQHGHELECYAETKGAGLAGLPPEGQVDHWVADQTVRFLKRQSPDRPFAAFIGFPSPHCPYDPTAEALARVDPSRLPVARAPTLESEALRPAMIQGYKQPWADLDYTEFTDSQIASIRHHYAALIEMLDEAIGKVTNALAASPLGENTVVIFASDHGDYVGDYRMIGKGTFFEPSIRVPLILADPRDPGTRRQQETVVLPDLFETILDLVGVNSPRPTPYRSLRSEGQANRPVFGVTAQGMMLRRGSLKLCRYANGLQCAYDLTRDSEEQSNVFSDPAYRPALDELDALLTEQLMRSMLQNNADKAIDAARNADPRSFYARCWQRPYPARL
ncbi:MAG: sulfatase-like hydrolase/transferase [Pseudomonadota bacterium]